MRTVLTLIIMLFVSGLVNAQNPEEFLDFWVGEWNLKWNDTDSTFGYGTNHIKRTLEGKVLEESFQANSGALKGFVGKSWSVFDKRSKQWKQTWVDNQGTYLDFLGGPVEGGFEFRKTATDPKGNELLLKMHFYDIAEDRFTWDWMRSTDDGENWTLVWRIWYERKNGDKAGSD